MIAAIGEKRDEHRQSLESGPGVAEVVPILAPYKVASREVKPEPTVVRAGSLTVGNCHIGMIAGPCSVESEEQMLATARAVKAAGATALRGGAFKPRTSPYSFQGLKEDGLKILAAARDETGLAVVTEVISASDVDLVASYADVLQIGARNMQNYRLLEAVGASGKPVLLKRGPSATLDELLLAAEYILNAGNPNVMLCERGIRTFETHTRFTLPLATVPYLHERTHLPVVVDPSHGTGHASLVTPMACRGDRRRGRRADRRGPSRPRDGPERRLPVAHLRAVRQGDGPVPQDGRRHGPADRRPRAGQGVVVGGQLSVVSCQLGGTSLSLSEGRGQQRHQCHHALRLGSGTCHPFFSHLARPSVVVSFDFAPRWLSFSSRRW